MIKIDKLTKIYEKDPVLKDFSLKLEKNQIVGLLGPNGSRKITLLKIICGLIQDSEGSILIHEKLRVQTPKL